MLLCTVLLWNVLFDLRKNCGKAFCLFGVSILNEKSTNIDLAYLEEAENVEMTQKWNNYFELNGFELFLLQKCFEKRRECVRWSLSSAFLQFANATVFDGSSGRLPSHSLLEIGEKIGCRWCTNHFARSFSSADTKLESNQDWTTVGELNDSRTCDMTDWQFHLDRCSRLPAGIMGDPPKVWITTVGKAHRAYDKVVQQWNHHYEAFAWFLTIESENHWRQLPSRDFLRWCNSKV